MFSFLLSPGHLCQITILCLQVMQKLMGILPMLPNLNGKWVSQRGLGSLEYLNGHKIHTKCYSFLMQSFLFLFERRGQQFAQQMQQQNPELIEQLRSQIRSRTPSASNEEQS